MLQFFDVDTHSEELGLTDPAKFSDFAFFLEGEREICLPIRLQLVSLHVWDFRGASRTEMRNKRGGFLTVMAVLLALAMVVDVLKALSKPLPPGSKVAGLQMPPSGIVVLGVRHTGAGSTILALLVAAVLFFYAVGIWRMKRYALPVAWLYAAYAIINVALFTIRNPAPPTPGTTIFAIVYLVGAIILTLGTAIALTRRRGDLI